MSCRCAKPIVSVNPRWEGTCRSCGKRIPPTTRPRDQKLERTLTESAAKAAGFSYSTPAGNIAGDDGGLTAYADHRAWPGGVRLTLDGVKEAREEYADARNYLVWDTQINYEAYLDGDPKASDNVARNMNSLTKLLGAWHALRV